MCGVVGVVCYGCVVCSVVCVVWVRQFFLQIAVITEEARVGPRFIRCLWHAQLLTLFLSSIWGCLAVVSGSSIMGNYKPDFTPSHSHLMAVLLLPVLFSERDK